MNPKFSKLIMMVIVGLSLGATVGLAGCHASFCVGSGCNRGTIEFGKSFQQSRKGGDISIVGKKSTFRLGQDVAMVAHLSQNAKTKTLALRVTGNGDHMNVAYPVSAPTSNVLAYGFSPKNLAAFGITKPGTYTFELLRKTKMLAKGSLTEK